MIYTPLEYDKYKKYCIEIWQSNSHSLGFIYRFEFPNGYGAFVIKSKESYGNEDDLFELAVLKGGKFCFDTEITDDAIGFLSNENVLDCLERIKNL